MSVTNDMDFEEIFKISTSAMRVNRCHPGIFHDKLWRAQCLFFNVVSAVCCVLLVNSIFGHDIQSKKYAEASKNGIMVIVAITITFKYFILVRYQDSTNTLIRLINEDYALLNTLSADERKIVLEYSKRGIKVCRLWLAISIASTLIFPLKACLLMVYLNWKGEFRLIPMFDLTYPDIVDTYKDILPVYCALTAMTMSFACYASTMYLGFDPLVPIFMLHCCGQIEVTSQRILKLFSETTDERKVLEDLKKIIIKLQDIYRFVDIVKANFTVLYEFTMKTTTFLLPLTAFQVFECLRNLDTNLEFIPFFFGTIIHFYLPCFYSDLLMEKSKTLRQAIYSCGWERRGAVRVRRYLIFMMARAARPLVLSTVFYPICLDTFAEVMFPCRVDPTPGDLFMQVGGRAHAPVLDLPYGARRPAAGAHHGLLPHLPIEDTL